MVDLYAYIDYRRYLRDWFKSKRGRPSQARFAAKVGCVPSMVSQILTAKRNIDASVVGTWSRHLDHDADQERYFVALVEMADEGSRRRRSAARAYVDGFRTFSDADTLDDARVAASWYHATILELSSCEGFVADPEWISSRLVPPVSLDEVAAALEHLADSGRLDRAVTPEGALLRTGHEVPKGEISDALLPWYVSALERASFALSSIPAAERHFSSVMLALPCDRLAELKKRLAELEREFVASCSGLTGDRDQVFQIAIALFPTTTSSRSSP